MSKNNKRPWQVAASILLLVVEAVPALASPGNVSFHTHKRKSSSSKQVTKPVPANLDLFNTNTKENITVPYPKDGQYSTDTIEKLNYFFRDYRYDEVKPMDIKVLDLMFSLCEKFQARRANFVSGYRNLLSQQEVYNRSRAIHKKNFNGQVARPGDSDHAIPDAIDFSIVGVPPFKLYQAAAAINPGGVGFYKTFVHIDTNEQKIDPKTHEIFDHPRRWNFAEGTSKAKKHTP